MLSKIEIKLVDDEGNYSIAHVNYKGFVDTLKEHNIDIVYDALEAMVNNYSAKGKMEIKVEKEPAMED
jgi:4-diphosphocytidyl-2C-methyl-D-erythritol kinase